MLKIKNILTSILVGTIITMAAMTVSLLITMFQTKEVGKSYAFFKSMFFENHLMDDGAINVGLGFTGDYQPIILSILIISFIVFLFATIYSALKERRVMLRQK